MIASTPLSQTHPAPGLGSAQRTVTEVEREAPTWVERPSPGSLETDKSRASSPRHLAGRPWMWVRSCALLVGGLALIPTPAPGVLLILCGLKGLGRGFRWVRRIEVPIRRRLRRGRFGRLATGIG